MRVGQRSRGAVTFALEGESVGAVPESVEGGGAEQPIGEGIAPFGEVEIAGDDGGGLFVALGDEVMEIFVLRRAKGFEAEVVDDEQRDAGEVLEAPLEGIDGARGVERAEELALGGEQHVMAFTHGGVTERLGDVAFAGAAGPGDEDRDFFRNEAAGGELDDEGLVDGVVEVVIELLEGFR